MACSSTMEMDLEEESHRSLFSLFEKQLLLKLVQRYKHIIETKDLNKATWRKKAEAFDRIEKEFNQVPGVSVHRTSRQLRQCYFNLKKRIAKNHKKGIIVPELAAQQNMHVNFDFETPIFEVSASSESNECSFVQINKGYARPFEGTQDPGCPHHSHPPEAGCTSKPGEQLEDGTSSIQTPSMGYASSASGMEPLVELIETAAQAKPSDPDSISTAIKAASGQHGSTCNCPPPEIAKAMAQPKRKLPPRARRTVLTESMRVKLQHNREEKEHTLRVKLLESQIAVQEKILDVLTTNPQILNLVLSGH